MSSALSLGFATFFTVAALVLVALAFGTDNWISTFIEWNKAAPRNAPQRILYSRHTGLFRECFVNNSLPFLRSENFPDRDDVVDGRCILVEYEIPENPKHAGFSDEYWAMIHLKRTVVAFFIVAMVFLLAGAVFGSIACWKSTSKPAQVAGIFVFLGAFFAAGAMAIFHGAEYIEKNKLNEGQLDPSHYYKNWPDEIKTVSIRRYSWSYILGWVGVGLSIIAAILYLFTAWYISDKKRENELYEKYSTRSLSRGGTLGRPVVYVEEPMTYAYPPNVSYPSTEDVVYVVNGKQPRGYIGPYETKGETWDYRY